MHTELHSTALGIFFACLFAGCMINLLWWMLHPPAPVSEPVAKAHRSVGAIRRILVPTVGMAYAERAVELACRMGADQKAEVILTYVLEVPRTLPLDVPMPEAENEADEAVFRSRAIVALHGLLPSVRIERARVAGDGIINAAKEVDADLIVMGVRPHVGAVDEMMGRTTNILLQRSPCEVIIDRIAEE